MENVDVRVRVRVFGRRWSRGYRGDDGSGEGERERWHQRPVATNAPPYALTHCDSTLAGVESLQAHMTWADMTRMSKRVSGDAACESHSYNTALCSCLHYITARRVVPW